MRKAARVIVVHNQNLLVMKRSKFGFKYYCLVGGAIEPGETADQAAQREAKEETGLTLANLKLVFVEDAGKPYGTQYIFLADYQDGDLHLSPNSIEAQLNKGGQNLFEPMWLPVSKFANLPFRSTTLQKHILTGLRDGFPQEPQSFSSGAEIQQTKKQEG
jgi:ADP-ribose pyrophosphatase YjhB (NUDIX family)